MKQNFQQFINGLQHIGIPTNDIDETIDFYKILGFEVAFQTVNEIANEKVAFLRLENITIEVYENKQAAAVSGALDHIALNVTDIKKVFEMAKEQNFNIIDKEIQFLPFWDNGVKFFTIIGPNKEKIEFSQYL